MDCAHFEETRLNRPLITHLIIWVSLLSTVFIVSPSLWNQTVAGKYFYFAAVVAVATLVTAYRLFRRRAAFRICLTDVAVFCLMAWIGFSCAINRTPSGMNLWIFILLIPLYVTIRASLHDRNMIRPLLWVIMMAVTVEAIWGLLQLHGVLKSYHSVFAISGSFFNPGPYAGFLACGIPLALHCLLSGRAKAEKFLGFACLITAGLILPATMSRAAWLAIVAGGAPVIIRQLKIKKTVLFVFAGIFIVGAFLGLHAFKKSSIDGRLLIWRVSANIVSEKPLTGSGLGSFQVRYDGSQADYFLSKKVSEKQRMIADTPEYAFNEYVQITVEHGIIGLLLFLGVIYSLFARSSLDSTIQKFSDSKIAVNGSLITFLVFAFFSYPFSMLGLTVLFVVLLAMSASLSQPVERLTSRWSGTIAGILCLVMAGFACVEILSRYTAYREWKSAQAMYNIGYFEDTIDNYRRLYPKMNRQKQFLFEYARCLSATGKYKAGNEMLVRYLSFGSDPAVYNSMGENYKKMGDYENAEKMYFRASQIVPSRHYPLYLLMNMYKESEQIEKAKNMATILLEKPVKVPSKAITEIQEEARELKMEN